MSIKRSLQPVAIAAALTVTLVSGGAFAQTPPAAAGGIQKPVAPAAPAVAPVAQPAAAAPLAEQVPPNMPFKALTPAAQAHIAITHERAARALYEQDTRNLDDTAPQRHADLKQELISWFSALPLSREIELKRHDEMLSGRGTPPQKQEKAAMPFAHNGATAGAPPAQSPAPAAP